MGVVLVTTARLAVSTLGNRYTPGAIISVKVGRYSAARVGARVLHHLQPEGGTVPSFLPPMVIVLRCARPWVIETMFSLRVSDHRTGRPARRAAQASPPVRGRYRSSRRSHRRHPG